MEKIDFTIFRQRFQELIDHSGHTRTHIARQIGVNPPTMVRWFNETRTPDLQYVVAICDYFGVTMEWLLGLDDEARRQTLTDEAQKVLRLYNLATPQDRLVINTILQRYEAEE